jgi:hypothetical protein
MALERFGDDTRHMIVFDVLSHSSPVGDKGELMRLFLTDVGYQKAMDSQSREEIKILRHAKVSKGDIFYDRPKEHTR